MVQQQPAPGELPPEQQQISVPGDVSRMRQLMQTMGAQ
jgi:hypothetical protein